MFAPGEPDESEGFRVVFVGRLEADKQPDLLVRALAIARRDLDVRATIVGDGPDRERGRALIEQLDMNDTIELLGRVPRDEVARTVAACHVGVSASLVETFGVAVAECAAAGLPLVAPEQRPFDEVLPTEGRVLYEPGSAEALAEALRSSASIHWDRPAIRRSIVERFSPEQVGRSLVTVYERAIGDGNG